MKPLRSLVATGALCLAALCLMGATPGKADAQLFNTYGRYYGGYGAYNYPHYWSNWGSYRPYSAFNYGLWNNRYGGYYSNNYPYYGGYRNYYWNWRY